MADRMLGIIRSWGPRGFGFIVSGEQSFYVHVSQLLFPERADLIGTRVTFIPKFHDHGGRNPAATKVKLTDRA